MRALRHHTTVMAQIGEPNVINKSQGTISVLVLEQWPDGDVVILRPRINGEFPEIEISKSQLQEAISEPSETVEQDVYQGEQAMVGEVESDRLGRLTTEDVEHMADAIMRLRAALLAAGVPKGTVDRIEKDSE